jgi:hypothetical protein
MKVALAALSAVVLFPGSTEAQTTVLDVLAKWYVSGSDTMLTASLAEEPLHATVLLDLRSRTLNVPCTFAANGGIR